MRFAVERGTRFDGPSASLRAVFPLLPSAGSGALEDHGVSSACPGRGCTFELLRVYFKRRQFGAFQFDPHRSPAATWAEQASCGISRSGVPCTGLTG